MILSKISKCSTVSLGLLLALSACGPKKPAIPNEVETVARNCYAKLVTPERTPKLAAAEPMEDGTLLILWSIDEFPEEQGSCTVDGSGVVLLLTTNADEQPAAEQPADEQPDAEQPAEPSAEQ